MVLTRRVGDLFDSSYLFTVTVIKSLYGSRLQLSAMVMPVGNSPRAQEKPRIVILIPGVLIMKALISGFALLTLFAATTLPIEAYAQTSPGGATAMAPDTGSPAASTTKKAKKSKSHAKKKSKKAPATQTSSTKQQHHSMNTGKRSRHSTG
jgi:hypothetical protein